MAACKYLSTILKMFRTCLYLTGTSAFVPCCLQDGVSEFKELDLNLTLEENGVMDESESFDDHQIGQEVYVPVLAVYWNDDLTVA